MPRKVYKAKYSGHTYNTYKEAILDNGSYLRAKRLTEQTNKIPLAYAGGTKAQTREQFWKQEPVLRHAVDSVASVYNINPKVLKARLNAEGFVDHQVQYRNNRILNNDKRSIPRGYSLLNMISKPADSIYDFGLDDAGTYLNTGKAKLSNRKRWQYLGRRKPEYETTPYDTGDFVNEHNRTTLAASGLNVGNNIGLVGSILNYYQNEVNKLYPNLQKAERDRYTNAFYNRGLRGGKTWVRNGAKGYNIHRSLETLSKQ